VFDLNGDSDERLPLWSFKINIGGEFEFVISLMMAL